MILFALLRPVHRDIALLATFFRLIGTTGFAVSQLTFLWALAPAYASPLLLLPAALAGVALSGWLLVKGVDVEKWRGQLVAVPARSL